MPPHVFLGSSYMEMKGTMAFFVVFLVASFPNAVIPETGRQGFVFLNTLPKGRPGGRTGIAPDLPMPDMDNSL